MSIEGTLRPVGQKRLGTHNHIFWTSMVTWKSITLIKILSKRNKMDMPQIVFYVFPTLEADEPYSHIADIRSKFAPCILHARINLGLSEYARPHRLGLLLDHCRIFTWSPRRQTKKNGLYIFRHMQPLILIYSPLSC